MTMSHPHHYFEELSVLESCGVLSSEESQELQAHMLACESCRTLADQCDTTVNLIRVAAEASHPTPIPPHLMKKLKDPRTYGIETATRERPSFLSLVFTVLLIVAIAASASFYAGRHSVKTTVIQKPVQLAAKSEGPARPTSQAAAVNQAEDLNQPSVRRTGMTPGGQQLQALQNNVDDLLKGKQQLQNHVNELENANHKLQSELETRQNELESARAELTDARRKEQADHLATDLAETELRQLRQDSTKLKQDLQESKRVQALLTDAQKLLEDPDLHTLDVDEHVRGRDRRGRIFFSEGKFCKFYAWNLGDPATTKNSVFYLWGETSDGDQGKIVNLGQFQLASQTARRWLIDVDPHSITQITSVFITREKSATTEPTGERMLSRVIKPLYENH